MSDKDNLSTQDRMNNALFTKMLLGLDKDDLYQTLDTLGILVDNCDDYEAALTAELKKLDLILIDLDHILELYKLSGSQMMKLTSYRKRIRLYRRTIKDSIAVVQAVKKTKNTQGTLKSILHILKDRINSVRSVIKNRSYRFRMLSYTFVLDLLDTETQGYQLRDKVSVQHNWKFEDPLHSAEFSSLRDYALSENYNPQSLKELVESWKDFHSHISDSRIKDYEVIDE